MSPVTPRPRRSLFACGTEDEDDPSASLRAGWTRTIEDRKRATDNRGQALGGVYGPPALQRQRSTYPGAGSRPAGRRCSGSRRPHRCPCRASSGLAVSHRVPVVYGVRMGPICLCAYPDIRICAYADGSRSRHEPATGLRGQSWALGSAWPACVDGLVSCPRGARHLSRRIEGALAERIGRRACRRKPRRHRGQSGRHAPCDDPHTECEGYSGPAACGMLFSGWTLASSR